MEFRLEDGLRGTMKELNINKAWFKKPKTGSKENLISGCKKYMDFFSKTGTDIFFS